MKRNKGIITILVGFGLLFTSFIFSSGYSENRSFVGNIFQMEIVLDEGEDEFDRELFKEDIGKLVDYLYPDISPNDKASMIAYSLEDAGLRKTLMKEAKAKYIEEHKIAIPLKYLLFLSVVLILVGTGVVFISKNKETDTKKV